MTIQAEVSLYPLQTPDLGRGIYEFIESLRNAGLSPDIGTMSTTVSGNANAVFRALGSAFQQAAEQDRIVLIIKVSNACPAAEAGEGGVVDDS